MGITVYCCLYPYSTQASNPTNWQIIGFKAETYWVSEDRNWIAQSIDLAIRRSMGNAAQKFEVLKTLAKNSPIRKFVDDSYQIPNAFLDIVIES